jgi:hypothetical protein
MYCCSEVNEEHQQPTFFNNIIFILVQERGRSTDCENILYYTVYVKERRPWIWTVRDAYASGETGRQRFDWWKKTKNSI